jgi:hypothetical protein
MMRGHTRGAYRRSLICFALLGGVMAAVSAAGAASPAHAASRAMSDTSPVGQPAACSSFRNPSGLAVSTAGTVYFAIEDPINQVLKVDPGTGNIALVAGVGPQGFAGDGGSAKAALLYEPMSLWHDSTGLFINDAHNARVRFVNGRTGIITTVAGNGKTANPVAPGKATAMGIWPAEVRSNGTGGLEIGSDLGGYYVNLPTGRLTPTTTHGDFFTVDPSNTTYSVPPSTTWTRDPTSGSAIDRFFNHSTKPLGFAHVTAPFTNADGVNATHADFIYTLGIASDAAGNIYVLDGRELNLSTYPLPTGQVREIDHATHLIHTLTGFLAGSTPDLHSRLAVAPNGDVYVLANYGTEILKRDHASGTVSLVAGGAGDPNYCP